MTEGLDMVSANRMPIVLLAKIVNAESYVSTDRKTAALVLHTRAKKEMRGPAWLALGSDDKNRVRKALTYEISRA